MKKITLAVLLFYFLFLTGIFGLNLIYPPVDTPVINSPLKTISVPIFNNPTTNSPTKAMPMGMMIILNAQEVSRHYQSNDCYLIVKNKVYDVSTYISKHPGGRRNITDNCGHEVTGLFASIHSNFAWDLLGKYYIGNLVSP